MAFHCILIYIPMANLTSQPWQINFKAHGNFNFPAHGKFTFLLWQTYIFCTMAIFHWIMHGTIFLFYMMANLSSFEPCGELLLLHTFAITPIEKLFAAYLLDHVTYQHFFLTFCILIFHFSFLLKTSFSMLFCMTNSKQFFMPFLPCLLVICF